MWVVPGHNLANLFGPLRKRALNLRDANKDECRSGSLPADGESKYLATRHIVHHCKSPLLCFLTYALASTLWL